MVNFVDLHKQYQSIKIEVDEAIQNVIRDSAYIGGKYVFKFEEEFAYANEIKNCISVANGTDALFITMKGLGLKQGDEVITTAHSWISTSETITQAGGNVVFCDTNINTFTIDPDDIVNKITSKTVGIIPVHLYGQPADMDAIVTIAKKYNLWIIEDCAQAHFAKYKNKKVGSFGDAATFSFYPGKNLGAYGDAGCIITNNDKLAEFCKLYARHGGKGEHHMEGINSRLDGLQAAILSVKLKHLNKWTMMRKDLAKVYNDKLSNIKNIQIPIVMNEVEHVYHLYVIKAEKRDFLKEYLESKQISTVLNYSKALPFYPAYSYLNHLPQDFPNSYKNQCEIISLPFYPELDEKSIDYVVQNIKNFYN
jgi:dTDP-4-amino-4,6-dideoxygalactose transaminase